VKGHLAIERAEVLEIVTEAVGEFAFEYMHEKLQPLTHELANLKAENVELRGMLGSALSAIDAVRATAEALQQERQIEKRDLAVRNQVIAERGARIAELQRDNSASHAELTRKHQDQEFARRDARLDLLETRLGMLLNFLSVGSGLDLPKGL
jgi:hypothetical protein